MELKPSPMVIRGPGDIDALYALFLGRLPESAFIREKEVGQPVLELVYRIIGSEEFATQIVSSVLQRAPLPHQNLSSDRLPLVQQFIVEAALVPLGNGSSETGWRKTLRRVLADQPCRSMAEARYGTLAAEFLDFLDTPEPPIVSGVDLIANTLCRGWVINQDNPEALLHVKVRFNGLTVKIVAADEFRRDIQARFGGSGRAGFSIRLDLVADARQLSQANVEISEVSHNTVVMSERVVEFSLVPALRVKAELREALSQLRKTVEQLEQSLPHFETSQSWPLSSYGAVQPLVDLVPNAPVAVRHTSFCIVVMDDGAAPQAAIATVNSVLAQTAVDDRVFLLSSAETSPPFVTEGDIEVVRLEAGEHPNEALNRIASRVATSHLLVLSAGMTFAPEALAWFGTAIARTGSVVVYSDQDQLSAGSGDGARLTPVFRPAFDPELLLQRNYIGETFCVSRPVFVELGGFTSDSAVDSRHDFLLRATARFGRGCVIHVPLLLVRAQSLPTATGGDQLLGTIRSHLHRIGAAARVVLHQDNLGRSLPDTAKVIWPVGAEQRVSIIVPTRDDAEMVSALLASLHRCTAKWNGIEIVVVVNGNPNAAALAQFAELQASFDPVRVVYRPMPFNWGGMNNIAVREFSDGEMLVFLNDDMLCLVRDWDVRLRSQLGRQDIAVLGGRLLYPNGTIQHAGIVFGHHAQILHEGAGDASGDGLYLDRTLLAHETAAVTGAFLACRRDTFENLGGFDTERFAVTCSDIDLCVRARAEGGTVLYDPSLTWIHCESVSRGFDDHNESTRKRFDLEFTRWRAGCAELDLVDLSLNPHLVRSPRPFELFHRLDAATVDAWLDAQLYRRELGIARASRRIRRELRAVQ